MSGITRHRDGTISFYQRTWRTFWLRPERIVQRWTGRRWERVARPRSVTEFEEAYAERSGVTVEWLHAHGRYGAPCDCGDESCDGFQMTYAYEDALIEDELRAVSGQETT